MKIKITMNLELEDFLEEKAVEKMKEKENLKTDKGLINHIKAKLMIDIENYQKYIADSLGVESASVSNLSVSKVEE